MADKLIRIERHFELTKDDSDSGEFEGYASVFDTEDSYGEFIAKGAFKKGLQKLAKEKRKLKMLWNHNRDEVIGTYTEAHEDDKGLYVRGRFTRGVRRADETHLLMKDGAVDSMSIGAYVIKFNEDVKAKKITYTELQLREVSPVTFPALDAARVVSVKSLSEVSDLAELERHLRDVGGFTHDQAKAIIAKSKALTPQRDVAGQAEKLRQAINNLKG